MQKEFLFFDWVVVDDCNLRCEYCVNKGEYSHRKHEPLLYLPGQELEIAKKIVEISAFVKNMVVTFTGGEPLIAKYLSEVIALLKAKSNIKLVLITNFRHIDTIAERIADLDVLLVSLHIAYRSDTEIEQCIETVNALKHKVSIRLSQVNRHLRSIEREKLAEIGSRTGLEIEYQPFIPPWTESGKIKNAKKIRDTTFVPSFGKRCALGYFYYIILPDGRFYYGLWCNPENRRTGNILATVQENRHLFFSEGMEKCQTSSCGCNYNTFYYDEYLKACKQLGYSDDEIFGSNSFLTKEQKPKRYLPEKLRQIFSEWSRS